MSDIKSIERTVSALLARNAKLDIPTEQFGASLHLDSLAMLEVILGLEKEYGLEVDESEMDLLQTFDSINSIARFVHENGNDTNG